MSAAAGLGLMVCATLLHWRARRALRSVGIAPEGYDQVRRPAAYLDRGVYRLVHPLYISYILFISGVGVLALGPGGAVLSLPVLPFYSQRIAAEARFRKEWTIAP